MNEFCIFYLQTLKKRRYLMSVFYEFSTATLRQSESVFAIEYANSYRDIFCFIGKTLLY